MRCAEVNHFLSARVSRGLRQHESSTWMAKVRASALVNRYSSQMFVSLGTTESPRLLVNYENLLNWTSFGPRDKPAHACRLGKVEQTEAKLETMYGAADARR